jgi:hypothetical protein
MGQVWTKYRRGRGGRQVANVKTFGELQCARWEGSGGHVGTATDLIRILTVARLRSTLRKRIMCGSCWRVILAE